MVDTNILCKCAKKMGLRSVAAELIRSYVNNRVHYTFINGDRRTLNMGVSQGSVLGPLLNVFKVQQILTLVRKEKQKLFNFFYQCSLSMYVKTYCRIFGQSFNFQGLRYLHKHRYLFLTNANLSLVHKLQQIIECAIVYVLQYHYGMLAGVHSEQLLEIRTAHREHGLVGLQVPSISGQRYVYKSLVLQ